MVVIGEVEVRIIEGNCVDRRKAWREVKARGRSRGWWWGKDDYLAFLYLLYITPPQFCLANMISLKAVIKVNPFCNSERRMVGWLMAG